MKQVCVRQHSETDCGAASLTTVCHYYGKYVNVSEVRELTDTDSEGVTLFGIYKAAQKLGFEATALKGGKDDLLSYKLNFPIIAHMMMYGVLEHYIVVYAIDQEKECVIAADPARGIVNLSFEDFFSWWKGYVLNLVPSRSFSTECEKKGKLSAFFYLVKSRPLPFLTASLLSLGVSAGSIAMALFFQFIVDNIVPNSLTSKLTSAVLVMVLICIISATINYCRAFLIAKLTRDINSELMSSYLEHVVHLPMSFYSKWTTGDIVSRIFDVDAIREAISNITLTLMLDTFLLLLGAVVMFCIDLKMFAIALIVSVLYAISISIFNGRVKETTEGMRIGSTELTTGVIDTVQNMEVIKAFCAEKVVKKNNANKLDEFLQQCKASMLVLSKQGIVSGAIISIGTVAILGYGAYEVICGNISMGQLIAFYAIFTLFASPISNVADLQPTVQSAKVSAERVQSVLSAECENFGEEGSQAMLSLLKSVQFKNVTFQYGSRKTAIDGISFAIHPNEKIGIAGDSGSGKTTIAKIIMKMYEPSSGEVVYNDITGAILTPQDVRKHIAYVPQEVNLFQGSIMDNISVFGTSPMSSEEIRALCKEIGIDEWISELPDQYDYIIAENGANLSGGQKQMISIARCMARKAEYVLLDEATSHIDPRTEKAICDAIDRICAQATTIIIAHRLQTLKKCDRIILIRDGKIEQIGTHEQLLASSRYYQELWEKQTI